MKRFFGWFLAIGGVFFSLTTLAGLVAELNQTVSSGNGKIAYFVYLLCLLLLAIWGCVQGIRLIRTTPKSRSRKGKTSLLQPKEDLMTSQYPALYVDCGRESFRKIYLSKLAAMGISRESGEKLFRFECDVVRKFKKPYLLRENFTKGWMFDLQQPLFRSYPVLQEDILKERSLTVSELAKIVDEAEWHFWNSHERNLPDAVWSGIWKWRRKGSGGEFAVRYFEMISLETGVSMEELMALNGAQGAHLSRYKWS